MYVIILLLSHTIADFILQTEEIIKDKSDFKIKGYLLHGLILLITSSPIFFAVKINQFFSILFILMLIILSHQVIDYIKALLQKKVNESKNNIEVKLLGIFFFDQLIHFIIIIIIGQTVSIEFSKFNNLIVYRVFNGSAISYEQLKMLLIILYSSFSGIYVIPMFLNILYKKIPDYSEKINDLLKKENDIAEISYPFIDDVKTGKWIGVLERLLVSVALLLGQIQLIGFILAAKSLARFKQLDKKVFSEYFLIGTLLSFIYAVGVYCLFNSLL